MTSPESTNKTKKIKQAVIWGISFLFGAFHMYTAFFGSREALYQRTIHLAFAGVLCFMIYTLKPKKFGRIAKMVDIFLILFSILPTVYLILDYAKLRYRFYFIAPLAWYQYLFCIMLVIFILEGTRRTLGNALPIIAIIALGYMIFGKYLPGILGHGGFTPIQIVDTLYQTTEGIFGIALGASATYVIMFIIFGAFLQKSGLGDYFIQIATTLTKNSKGGPAKAAVISSGLFGMISGSSTANVVTTGQITIPLMIRTGYSPVFAGAVEAVASTGGQIMPPVMGAAAFIMAEFTGIPYAKIIIYAFIPGFLYYFAIFTMVHYEAVRLNLKNVAESDTLDLKSLMRKSYMLLPIVTLVVVLILGYSPTYSVLWSLATLILLSCFDRKNRLRIRDILDCIAEGAQSCISIAMACACAGIVVGVVNYSGVAVRISSMLVSMSNNNLFLALIITAITAIILGMGLPTTPAYIVVCTLLIPSITRMGVPLIAAHLFAFHFANVSAITPPVALSAYAAAGISKANPMTTGYQAFRLGIASYIVPFMFAYNQELLLIGDNIPKIIWAVISAMIGVYFLAVAAEGYFVKRISIWQRVLLFIGAIMCIHPELLTDAVGFIIGSAILLLNYRSNKKTASAVDC